MRSEAFETLELFEQIVAQKIQEIDLSNDPAHDFLHFKRVVSLAKKICQLEHGKAAIVVPAAWLHDCVIIPKDSPLRHKASRLSAEKALEILASLNYPSKYYNDIAHAIECHSFSANIEALTLEAKIVQDADRLDGLGAIGIARCFATAGMLKRPFYNHHDPFCERRPPDDSLYTVDHFFKKLFKTVDTLKTATGREEGKKRAEMMNSYLAALKLEI
ncbi:MAG: HD domain-containing protein [Pseudomonadota bacterium]